MATTPIRYYFADAPDGIHTLERNNTFLLIKNGYADITDQDQLTLALQFGGVPAADAPLVNVVEKKGIDTDEKI